MRIVLIAATSLALAACSGGEQSGNDLSAAAEQSDPAAAAVLEQAARNGTDPQVALQEAGNAAALQTNAADDGVTVQARPNLPGSPNRKDGTRPPDKIAVPTP